MDQGIFYRDNYVTLRFIPEIPCVHETFHGYVPSEAFRSITQRVIHYIKDHKAQYPHIHFLSDCRQLGVLKKDDIDWAANEADPELYAHGCRRIAFIMPISQFADFRIKQYRENAQPKGVIESMMFKEEEEARAWLLELRAGGSTLRHPSRL